MADDLHATWTADGRRARNGWFSCTVTNVDPRVAGTSRYTWNANRWGTSADSGSMVQWGTARITNSGGSWESRYTGVYTSQTGDIVTHVFIGKGSYAGLSYYMWAYETFGPTWPTQGLIFPGTLPSR